MCKAVILLSLSSTYCINKIWKCGFKSRNDFKSSPWGCSHRGLAETFCPGCEKVPNCWELKESSKRLIILNLSCPFCFGHCGGQDSNLGGPLVWHSLFLHTHKVLVFMFGVTRSTIIIHDDNVQTLAGPLITGPKCFYEQNSH